MFDLKLQNYIDWNVKPVFKRKERDRYAYRVVLIFGDGSKHIKQHSGFMTKKEARKLIWRRSCRIERRQRMTIFLK